MSNNARLTLSLTTTGRRSGKLRTVTLYGFADGDRVVIVGSRGGAARHPAWVHNLRSQPRATMKIGRQVQSVLAREVDGAERGRPWQLVTEAFPLYATYQRRTKRTIPLFVLEPAAEDA